MHRSVDCNPGSAAMARIWEAVASFSFWDWMQTWWGSEGGGRGRLEEKRGAWRGGEGSRGRVRGGRSHHSAPFDLM